MSEVADRAPVKLGPSRLEYGEHVREQWHVKVEPGIIPQDILNPLFWSHVAGRLRPLAEITLVPQDKTWYMRVLVMSVTRVDAVVKQLEFVNLLGKDDPEDVPTDLPVPEGYTVKFVNPATKHRVVRNVDKAVLKEGMETQNEAVAWLKNHLKGK